MNYVMVNTRVLVTIACFLGILCVFPLLAQPRREDHISVHTTDSTPQNPEEPTYIPIEGWEAYRELLIGRNDVKTRRYSALEEALPVVVYGIPVNQARGFSIESTVFAKHETTSYLCPNIVSFTKVEPQDLSCDEIRKATQDTQTSSQIYLDPNDQQRASRVCICDTYWYNRYCSVDFIGRYWKEETKGLSPNQNVQNSLKGCEILMKSSKTVSRVGKLPDWPCWWMEKNNAKTEYTDCVSLDAKVNVITGGYSSSYIKGGSCSNLEEKPCSATTGGLVVKYGHTLKETEKPKEVTKTFEITWGPKGTMYTQWWDKFTGAWIVDLSCSVKDPWGTCWLTSSSGHYVRSPTEDLCAKPRCSYGTTRQITPGYLPPNVYPTREELLTDLRTCIIGRQALITAITAGTYVDKELLEVYNTRISSQSDGTAKAFYAIVDSSLVTTQCQKTTFEEVKWVKGDVWMVYYGGMQVGCYDAKISLLQVTGCVVESAKPTRPILMNGWEVENLTAEYPKAIYTGRSDTSKGMEDLLYLSESISNLTNSMKEGVSVVVKDISDLVQVEPDTGFQTETTGTNFISDFLNSFAGIGYAILSLCITVAVIIGISCCIRKCCSRPQVVVPHNHIEMQEL